METKGDFITGTKPACDVDTDCIDFCVDTAGSWDGSFLAPHKGDYVVSVYDYADGGIHGVLVSSRYTAAVDFDNAAELAVDAFIERSGHFAAAVTAVDALED